MFARKHPGTGLWLKQLFIAKTDAGLVRLLHEVPPCHADRQRKQRLHEPTRPDQSCNQGAAGKLLDRARKDFAKGEFRFVAQAVSHLVFAEPDNAEARAMLADTFEQLGYAAESSTWRNAYLFGAQELRQGMPKAPPHSTMPRETLAALRTEQLWDVLGVRLNGPKAEGKRIVLNWTFTDTGENFILNLENSALTYTAGAHAADADAGFTLARGTLDEVIAKLTTFQDAVAGGKVKFTGNPMRLGELMALMDEFPRMFEIVEPKRTAVS